jgi:hypothetical protein
MTRLDDIAAAALKKHSNNPDKALPDFLRTLQTEKLIDDLARWFLRQVAGRGSGPATSEAHTSPAGPAPPAPPPPKVGSIKVAAHDVRQHRRRTQAEKDAADRAMMASAEAVFEMRISGRAIGKYRIGELASLKRDLIKAAVDGILLHTIEVRDAIIAEQIEQHCSVQDQLTPVAEVVDAKTLARFVSRAEHDAPGRIQEALRLAREAIDRTKELAE